MPHASRLVGRASYGALRSRGLQPTKPKRGQSRTCDHRTGAKRTEKGAQQAADKRQTRTVRFHCQVCRLSAVFRGRSVPRAGPFGRAEPKTGPFGAGSGSRGPQKTADKPSTHRCSNCDTLDIESAWDFLLLKSVHSLCAKFEFAFHFFPVRWFFKTLHI